MIDFDPTTHTYRFNGHVVPSVTGILKSVGLIDTRWFDKAAAWRGSGTGWS